MLAYIECMKDPETKPNRISPTSPVPAFRSLAITVAGYLIAGGLALNAPAQTLVSKWQNSAVGTTTRCMAYNPTTTNLLLVFTTPAIKRFNAADGTSAGADMDMTGVSGGQEGLRGIAVQADGTIWACNYVIGASASQNFTLYRWDSETSAPTIAYQYGLPAPGVGTDRFGSGLSVYVIPGVSTNWIIGNPSGTAPVNAGLLIYDSSGYTFKLLTVGLQIATPGLTIVDYNAPGFANRFRVVAKSRGTGGQIYNFDPSAASPIVITTGSTAMSGGFTFAANGITSHAYDPVTKLLAGTTCTLQAAPFSYTNLIFGTPTSIAAAVERSRITKTATAADGGTAGATVWGTDGRLYSTIPQASVGINAFDVTAFLVSGISDLVATAGDASVKFSGAVFGGSELVYSWKKGATLLSDSSKYSGTTTASLTISNLVPADADTYTVTVTGVSGSTTNSSAALIVNNGPIGPKTWQGLDADDNWSSPQNWVGGVAINPGGDTAFFDGNTRLTPLMNGTYNVAALTFNPTAGAFVLGTSGGTLTLGGGVTNLSALEQSINLPLTVAANRSVNTDAGNVVVNGTISGLGSITKIGAQTLKLRGTSANTYNGLAVNAGTVALGKTAGVDAAGGAITVVEGATLVTEASEQIANASIVDLQTGNGTLSIADGATESFAGVSLGSLAGVDLTRATNKGAVQLGANAQLILTPNSSASVGPCAVQITAASPAGTRLIVRSSGGEIRWTPTNMVNTFEKLVIDGGRVRLGHGGNAWNGQDTMLGAVPASFMQDQICITNGQIGFNGAALASKILVHANRGMTISGNATNECLVNANFPGKITGPGILIHNGGGDLELEAANDFSGGLRLGAGAVVAKLAASVGTGPITFISSQARLAASTDGIVIPNYLDLSAVITNSFGYVNSFTLSGPVNLGNTGSDPQLNVTNAATTVTFTGQMTNSLGLVKNGDGKVVLTGNNTYGGGTHVLRGTLEVNNTTGSATSAGAVTVEPDGTLAGTGSVAGAVTLNGTVAPGASPGTITTGDETWNGAGRYAFEINDATGTAGANPGWDKIAINGSLNIAANSGNPFILDVTSLSGSVPGNCANFNNTVNQEWVIATTTTGITGFDPAAFTINTANFSNPLGSGIFVMGTSGNNLVLRLVIPQPPQNLIITGAGTGSFVGTPNLTYTVQFTDSLDPLFWQTLTTVATDGSGNAAFTDPGPLPDTRFYRVSYP